MVFKKAREVLSIIESHGYAALIVGGAVRDLVMNRTVPDIDLATDMPLEMLSGLFSSQASGKSRRFGILGIRYQGARFEVSKMCPGTKSQGQGPVSDERRQDLFRADALHRDFTINAMAMDRQGRVLDPLNGRQDIKNRIIRAVREPERVFNDDSLRLLRAVRFACTFGFEMDPRTFEGLRRSSLRITRAAPERTGMEIMKMASLPGKDFARALSLMEETYLLDRVLPEIGRLRYLEHNPLHHPEGGVLEHTLAALRAGKDPDPGINLSILFHDAGKALSLEYKNNQPVYHGHDQSGEEIIRKAGQRLRWSGRLVETLCFVCRNHMKALDLGRMKPSKVFRLMTHLHWPVLKAVARCDLQARGKDRADKFEHELHEAALRLEKWLDREKGSSRPVITGRQVMEYTGLSQGPEVGKVLELTTSWAIDNQVTDADRIREFARSCARRI